MNSPRKGLSTWYVCLMVAGAIAPAGVATAQDSEPEAIFTMTPEQPVINVAFRVDASQSFDRPSAGPIASYSWTFGDGSAPKTGVTVQHTYTQAGRYTITLTVRDSENPANTDTATRQVTISSTAPPPNGGNKAPVPALTVNPLEGEVEQEFTFNASGSKDADNDPLIYRFNFGDGEETEFDSEPIVTHQYAEAGTYVARVTVRDDQNASADITVSVRVLGVDPDNRAPVALIATGPRTGAAPATLSFDGRISYDPDGDPIGHSWTFMLDGEEYSTGLGSVVNQLFAEPGTYSVILEVTDTSGATGTSATEIITISEAGEPVEPPPPAPVPEPEDPPPSYTQRPPSVCGMGALLPMLACLMGMAGARLARRR